MKIGAFAEEMARHAPSLPWDPMQHMAVIFGDIREGVHIPVRLHLEDVSPDVFGVERSVERYTSL
ncbi:GTP cyclohydrolase II [Rhizobium sp. BK619]|nr:GTP cyclohydrolase II [Rhizobium sp. BK619]